MVGSSNCIYLSTYMQYANLSTYQHIYLFINSIYLFIDLSISLPIFLFINLFIDLPTYLSIHFIFDQSMYLFVLADGKLYVQFHYSYKVAAM